VSSDQITYVLVAFIVTGVAILLLLAGAFVARRGRGSEGHAMPAGAPDLAPAAVSRSVPVTPATLPPPVAELPPAAPPAPAAQPAAAQLPTAAAEPPAPQPAAEHGPEEVGVTAADLEAAARRVHDPREQDVIEGFLSIAPRRREPAAFDAPRQPTAAGPAGAPGGVATEAPAAAGAGVAGAVPPDPYIDDVTGLDSRAAWDRALAEENARYVRYRRPVGIVIAELDGLVRFEREFGTDAARRIMTAVGGAMRRGARRTDRVAHVGGGRFLVLLPETDEIQAINYVERVRSECERWLEAGAVALHVAMGWASPSAVGELDTAVRTAEERMYAERRRAARAGVTDSDASR
jgi:diguanylate cyclase (GGDEF)-like protein